MCVLRGLRVWTRAASVHTRGWDGLPSGSHRVHDHGVQRERAVLREVPASVPQRARSFLEQLVRALSMLVPLLRPILDAQARAQLE